MRLVPALAVAALTVAALTVAAPEAGAHPAPEHVCVASVPETDPLEPGPVRICVSVFKPATASRDDRAPVLLHSHGWGGTRTSAPGSFQRYLDAGFGVVSIDQRGFGESGGKAHVEDPAFEGEDVIRVIDHVASLDWVRKNGPNDPVLGAIGGSYGGGYQFVGAFTEIMKTGRTRFDALAPQITWHSLNDSLAPREVVRTTWVTALYAAGLDAHTTTVHTGYAEGLVTGDWPAAMDEFFRDNGPAHHVAAGRRLDVPVLLRQGVSDNLFPLDQAIDNFDRALTTRARANSLLVGYNGGHALPSVLPPGYAVAGDACSAKLGGSGSGYDELELRFLSENLLGTPRTLTGHGRYHLMTAEGGCVSVDSVKPTTAVALPDIVTTAGVGVPQAIKIANGPLTIAGSPSLDALVTTLGLDSRAFFALSVGTSPVDAKVVQNNVLPHREKGLNLGARRTIELPSVATTVPAGQSLFLTVSALSDMFVLHGSRTPGVMVLRDVTVRLPVVR
ncbi:pimeloyl-ACP methyl ester carboxylesterase [Saccharothrix ecbatanensis]|uniref:Pimeloyl-ACP methyl ester carboxylesterase n=1 Tax=Saccharothrix ecbatanensis TaxID=1105145 RepID=A0A7W9HK83_9PSEU|nr:alpha/beta fold hydrolase [Saccharothrix ecbatanensis]MBB5803827.1 pimeloyl-ACP methyl ester carboxylesterase [Saccharothrix ecbatanensis]